MAERAERAARVNDGFVETNKMLQEKQRFDLQRRDAIADKEKMEQQAANIVSNNMTQAELDEDRNKKNLYKQSLLYQ